MKPTLQLQIGQHLTMTPQLQQAIRLLQLSTLELQTEIQEALDSNPMLEMADSDGEPAEKVDDTPIDYAAAEEALASAAAAPADERPLDINNNEGMPDELPVDSLWEDVFSSGSGSATSSSGGDEDDTSFEARNAAPETLAQHLAWQLNLTHFSDLDRAIGMTILDAIDERGYLTADLEEILEAVADPEDPFAVELDEVEAVLHRIQQFDPPGVAGRDLRECLLIQLRQLPEDTPCRVEAMATVRDHLELLASRDFASLMRKLKLSETGLKGAISLIQSLNPNPGGRMGNGGDTEYVTPDVIVRRLRDRWTVELNPETAPRLRVNSGYAALVRRADSSADNTYLRNHLQEARWFIKSLQSRNDTLLKVASCIVEHQRAFLEQGPEAMKPMVLRDIAEEVGMHESTISRVTTQKFMHTPRGVFELKYFFSSHVGTTGGGEASSTAIRAMIRKLVGQEDPRKPLSDNKIADLLLDQGIEVARRTIAKYRESLNIPPSNERKRLV
ncbi:MAG: polymerase factor sigma-54 [Moraxellaceae bacterium]|jgi:RNA polymerase sigma-54 factor|nr:polymerase factor sigma-54 [Moraxellaceae bacterium]